MPRALKVGTFYRKMEWEQTTTQLYNDAWGLRKLYGYSHRRESDAYKRQQTPQDIGMPRKCKQGIV